jgi:NTP pyrophosphatase (non-canonical NTP hydrolase)
MDFKDYSRAAIITAVYPNIGYNYIYPTLGLVGEAGEVAEKVKRVIRDDEEKLTEERIKEIEKEIGDVLWYLSMLCFELGLSLEDVAIKNINKLMKRKEQDKIKGSGDDR